jgi:hypothetical protein
MHLLPCLRRAHTLLLPALLLSATDFSIPDVTRAAIPIPANTWVAQPAARQVLPSGRSGSYESRGWNHLRYDSVSGQMVLFDGYAEPPQYPLGNIYANSLWGYDPAANRLTLLKLSHWTRTDAGTVSLPENSTDPTPFDRHSYSAIVYVASRNAVYMWSGANSSIPDGYIGDMWSYSFAQHAWRPIPGPHPFTVFEQAMVYDPDLEKLVLFGGSDRGYHDGDKTYVFDLKSELWTDAAPVVTPAPRAGQTLCFDAARRVTWMFGGAINGQPTNELWRYDARANTWTQAPASGDWPDPRRFANMAYDTRHDIMLLWGGVSGSDANFSDTWVFHPSSGTWEKRAPSQSPPGEPHNYAEDMDYDPANDVFVLNHAGKFWLFRYAGGPGPDAPAAASAVQFRLLSSNPARKETRMSFTLAREAEVRIDLVDSVGRRVSTLVHGRYPAGEHQVDWAGGSSRRASSGVYYVRFAADGRVLTRRVVLVR